MKNGFLIFALAAHFASSASAAPPSSATDSSASVAPDYIVGPRDVLEIAVWKEDGLTKQALVRPDGGINFPLIGELHAGGLTVNQIRSEIAQKLSEFVAVPEVSVSVVNLNHKIYVVGRVNKPGKFVTPNRVSVMQVLSMVAGLTPFADDDAIKIIRRIGEKEVAFPFDYDEVASGTASALEKKLADFKEQNLNSLPEQKQINIELADRSERELMQIDNELRSLEDLRFYLDGQLAQIKPNIPVISSTGERILSPEDHLKSLRTEYLAMISRYSDRHPDVIKARLERDSLKRDSGDPDSGLELAKHLTQLDSQLASLREKYSENHPDIVSLRRQISALDGALKRAQTARTVRDIAADQPENPAYITLQAQRNSVIQDLRALRIRREEVKARLGEYADRLLQMPRVERQYLELIRDYENATARYRELKAKAMEAEVAEQLAKESKGERFSVIEPPLLPEEPVKPNRPAVAFLGVVLAVTGEFGYVLLMENLDQTVRGMRRVTTLAGGPPLAVIPYLETDEEVSQQQRPKTSACWRA